MHLAPSVSSAHRTTIDACLAIHALARRLAPASACPAFRYPDLHDENFCATISFGTCTIEPQLAHVAVSPSNVAPVRFPAHVRSFVPGITLIPCTIFSLLSFLPFATIFSLHRVTLPSCTIFFSTVLTGLSLGSYAATHHTLQQLYTSSVVLSVNMNFCVPFLIQVLCYQSI
jgi:hypothetical protein